MAALGFYLYTLAPSLVWADGARLQLDVMLGGSHYLLLDELRGITTDGWPFSRLGIAPWDHLLYVLLGSLFVLLPGDPLFLLNLMSALAAAATVALVYQLGFSLVRHRAAAMLGAAALAVSHTFWFHAVTAEVYSLHTLFMVSILALLRPGARTVMPKRAGAAAFLAGLGMTNHVMLVLHVIPLALHRLVRRTTTRWPLLLGLVLLGFSPWLLQFARMARAFGIGLAVQFALFYPKLPGMLLEHQITTFAVNLASYAGMLLYQFTPFGVALGLYGIIGALRARRPEAPLLVVLFGVHVLFSANYSVADRFAFHQPSYLFFSLFIVYGIAEVLSRFPGRVARTLLVAAVLSPVVIYAATPRALAAIGVTSADLGLHPIGSDARDGMAYFLNPNKRGDDSAARFARSTLEALPPDALVFSVRPGDREPYLVLRYFQMIEGLRPDVHVELYGFTPEAEVPAAMIREATALAGCRPLYLVSLNPELYPITELTANFDFRPDANLFRLEPATTQAASSPCPSLADLRSYRTPRELVGGAFE